MSLSQCRCVPREGALDRRSLLVHRRCPGPVISGCCDRTRLTQRAVERLKLATGLPPGEVRCRNDLDAHVRRCKEHDWGTSRDTQFLH